MISEIAHSERNQNTAANALSIDSPSSVQTKCYQATLLGFEQVIQLSTGPAHSYCFMIETFSPVLVIWGVFLH